MSGITPEERLALKTPEASFLHVLQSEFNLSPRETQEVVNIAREMLGLDCPSDQARPGQVRLVVASLKAPFGPPLSETDRVEVTLTVDGGPEGAEVKAGQGREGLRRGRMLWVLDEALEQGSVLAEEDVARVLHWPQSQERGAVPEGL
jgi:hypothetical protein